MESIEREQRLIRILHEIGIPSHLSGFKYILECINYLLEHDMCTRCITTKVYPAVANKFNTRKECVEKNIRDAIDVGFTSGRGNIEYRDGLFGSSLNYETAKPTNTEFIVTIVSELLLEIKIKD